MKKITVNIPRNIREGVDRIALVLGVAALILGFFWGANGYWKENTHLTPDFNYKVTKEIWTYPSLWETLACGVLVGSSSFVIIFYGFHGVVRLSWWVYEGFKEEKKPPGKRPPATRKK